MSHQNKRLLEGSLADRKRKFEQILRDKAAALRDREQPAAQEPDGAVHRIGAIKADDARRGMHRAAHAEPPVGAVMSDGTIFAGISPDTGQPMYTTQSDAPAVTKWHEALGYANKLDAHGHKDWRLPTKDELKMMFNNRAAIGGFETCSTPSGWYWSSSSNNAWQARGRRFSDGSQGNLNKFHHSSFRCVR